MPDLLQQLHETTSFIKAGMCITPAVGIVLGSGLGNFAQEINV